MLIVVAAVFFIDIASRFVHVAGITPHQDNSWMSQVARNITGVNDGFLRDKRYLTPSTYKYSDSFRGSHSRRRPSHPSASAGRPGSFAHSNQADDRNRPDDSRPEVCSDVRNSSGRSPWIPPTPGALQ